VLCFGRHAKAAGNFEQYLHVDCYVNLKSVFIYMKYTDDSIIVLLFVDSWEFVFTKGSCML
jgi:hypothetical protein